MILEILPNTLYSQSNVNALLYNKNSAIIYKTLSSSLIDKQMFLSSMVIIFVVKGEQIIRNYDGESILAKQGQMLALAKDMYLVSDFVALNETFEAMLFFIDDDVIEAYAQSKESRSLKKTEKNSLLKQSISKIKSNDYILEYIHSTRTIYTGKINDRRILELKLLELLSLLGLEADNHQFLSALNEPTKYRSIKKLMDDNYLNNLKVNDYASLSGRSVTTFIRDFKRVYGETPNKWLIKKRLAKAQDLLRNTALNVTDVSLDVGYENVSHFIHAYKLQYGVTPKKEKLNKN